MISQDESNQNLTALSTTLVTALEEEITGSFGKQNFL